MQNEKEAKEIDFEGETRDEIEAIKSKIGQEVPLSRRTPKALELCWSASLARPLQFGFQMAQPSATFPFATL